MTWKKGQSGNPAGKKPGVVDKSRRFRADMMDVYDKVGGMEGMVKWVKKSDKNRETFYKILAALQPREIKAEVTQKAKVLLVPPKAPLPAGKEPIELGRDQWSGTEQRSSTN